MMQATVAIWAAVKYGGRRRRQLARLKPFQISLIRRFLEVGSLLAVTVPVLSKFVLVMRAKE